MLRIIESHRFVLVTIGFVIIGFIGHNWSKFAEVAIRILKS